MPESAASSKSNVPQRRNQILDEAFEIVGNRGYQGLSFKDVAERCGLTKQGVLHYFPSKDQLLIALLNERDASMEADLLNLLRAAGFVDTASPKRKRVMFLNSLVSFVEHLLATPELIRLHVVLRAEATNTDHPAKDYFSQRDAATIAWLAQRLEPLSARPMSTARQIMAMMIGLQSLWLEEEQQFDLLSEWREALEAILR